MTTQVQIRGAATATQAARTLAARELDVDTTLSRLNVHNGSTVGGIPHANYKDVQNQEWVYAAASGTDSIAISLSKAPAAYAAGQRFCFKAANTNTASATLNVNSLGAKTIKKVDNGALATLTAGDIVAGAIYVVVYDGTDMLIVSGAGGSSSQDRGVIIKDGAFAGGAAFEDFTWSNGLYRRLLVSINDFAVTSTNSVNVNAYMRFLNNGTVQSSTNNYHSWFQIKESTGNTETYDYGSLGTTSQQLPLSRNDGYIGFSNGTGYQAHLEITNLLNRPHIEGTIAPPSGAGTTEMYKLIGRTTVNTTLFSGIRVGVFVSASSRVISSTSQIKIVGYP